MTSIQDAALNSRKLKREIDTINEIVLHNGVYQKDRRKKRNLENTELNSWLCTQQYNITRALIMQSHDDGGVEAAIM